jgi:glycosyltransferase involved in cell wall biosynthesis
MRALRVLHVTPYSADAWAYGGIPRLACALARGLARRGHQVTVCTTDACDATSRLQRSQTTGSRFEDWRPAPTADGVEVRVFPNLSNRLAYRYQFFLPFALNEYLSRHAGEFDIAHLHACRNVPGAMASHHLRRVRVPYVLAPNGTAPRIERRLLAKRAFDIVAGARVLRGASRVLAVSHAEQQQLSALGVQRSTLRVIPNAIDLDEFDPPIARGRFRQRVSLPPAQSCPVVMFLGQLTPRKRVDVLVHAFARLERTDARLVVAGNDMGAAQDIRAHVRSAGVENRTLFTGLLCGRQRLEALADADVVVYPSEHEVFGLVPFEALLAGTPVIVAGDSGCGAEVRETGGGQVVPPGDVDAVARAIGLVLAAPESWRLQAANAADRVKAAYGSDVVSARMEELYREMVVGS